jgi:hypothetical protein
LVDGQIQRQRHQGVDHEKSVTLRFHKSSGCAMPHWQRRHTPCSIAMQTKFSLYHERPRTRAPGTNFLHRLLPNTQGPSGNRVKRVVANGQACSRRQVLASCSA